MPAATGKSHRIRQPSAAGSGFRLANTLIHAGADEGAAWPSGWLPPADDVSPAAADVRPYLAGSGRWDQRVSASRTRRAGRPTRTGVDPLLPASRRRTAPCCLCTNVWMTCAQRRQACAQAVEILGIPQPNRNQERAFTWESASHTCAYRKIGNYPHATPQEMMNEPNVYRRFIRLLYSVGIVIILKPREGEPGAFGGGSKRNGGERLPDTLCAR